MKRVLIVGATSAIATACARLWAEQGAEFFLVARDVEKLEQTRSDLLARGAKAATSYIMDVTDFSSHAGLRTRRRDSPQRVRNQRYFSHQPPHVAGETIRDPALRDTCSDLFGCRRPWPPFQLSVRHSQGGGVDLL